MTPRTPKTRRVDRAESRAYLKKAADFYDAMLDARRHANWNSVGLTAVHCVISATDAVLAERAGIRSASPDHADAVQLVRLHVRSAGLEENSKRLLRVIRTKNVVEYESRSFTEREARSVMTDTERYLEWARGIICKG